MADEYVYMPVPIRWTFDIYARLAQLAAEDPEPEEVVPKRASDVDAETVARMYGESEAPHRRLLDLLASSSDEWLYTSDIAKQLALPNGSRSVAGMLGAFGRRAKHRYEGQRPWDSDWDPARSEARHRMPSVVAKYVRDAREQALARGAAP